MKIGQLNAPDSGLAYTLTTWKAECKKPCPPDSVQDGFMKWNWQTTMRAPVELLFTFEKPVFLSEVSLCFGEKTQLIKIELLTRDGEDRTVGVYRAETASDQESRQPGSFGGFAAIRTAATAAVWVVRLHPTLTGELSLKEPVLVGADFDTPVLYPTPYSCNLSGGTLPTARIFTAASDSHPDSIAALSYLQERISEQWGETCQDGDGVFISYNALIPADGYRLSVTSDGVTLQASNRLGLLYGVERLMELAGDETIPLCEIDDKPYKEMRGFHIGMPPRENIPLFEKVIRSILIPFHYNTIFLEFAGSMRFDSHPEISEAWLRGNELAEKGEIPTFPHGLLNAGGKLLEKDEVRGIVACAKYYGFDLIPEIQSLGHVQYITYAHPEIAEVDPEAMDKDVDTRAADQQPSTYFHHSYCPEHPKSYEIIFDIIEEILDVVKPKQYVHMGHDEVYQVGLCPRCKDKPHDELFEKHVRTIHDYLAKKGLRMMMWSDMLQKVYTTHPAVSRLPKDIIMMDFIWYFHLDQDLEENLLPHGYDVLMGNFYSSHYPRYESRAAKDHIIGGEVSTWVRFEEYALAKKGKLYDLMYSSQMLWSDTYDYRAREVYARILKERIPAIRDRLHGKARLSRRYTPLTLPDAKGQVPYALREACMHDPSLGLSPRRLREALTVDVHASCDALRFVHTTLFHHATVHDVLRPAVTEHLKAGTYTVCYADGTKETVLAEYDGNLRMWNTRWGMPRPERYYRHMGYVCTWLADPVVETWTEGGDDLTLLGFEWVNPHPDKEISEILCEETDMTAAALVLCGISTVDYI